MNNYKPEDEDFLKSLKEQRYIVFGREVGKEGTPHLQGYLYFKNKKSWKQVKKLLGERYHVEEQRGTFEDAIEYCKKDGDVYEFGDPPMDPKQSGLKGAAKRKAKNLAVLNQPLLGLVKEGIISINEVPVIKKAKIILEQEGEAVQTDEVRGEWYWGPPGVGKSHKARTQHPDAYIKAQNKWWCGYAGEEVVLLDDLDTAMLGHYLKIWADKWKCYGEVKGGKVALKHKKIIITSNYHPEELWKDDYQLAEAIKRRFKVTHFVKLK